VVVMTITMWGGMVQPAQASILDDFLAFFGLRQPVTATGGCDEWGCGTNSPIVDGAAIAVSTTPHPVRANFLLRDLICALFDVWCEPKPASGGGGCDDEFGCAGNSPIVDGAAITVSTTPRSVHPNSILRDISCKVFGVWCESNGGCDDYGCGTTNSPIVDAAAIAVSTTPHPVRANFLLRDLICALFDVWCEPKPVSGGGGCDEWGCGGNSPVVDSSAIENQPARTFHELHMGGLPNAAGFVVLGARKGSVAYTVESADGGIVARPKTPDAPWLGGRALVDLELDLRDEAGGRYTLRVAATNTTRFWAAPLDSFRTYSLTYAPVGDSRAKPLCTTGVNEAVLFSGDRYDALGKTVIATGDAVSGWINIACAGTALGKLYLTRHTEASQIIPTTRGERQAMFKMLTADVCGDGTTFTVHGQPLLWADAKGITTFAGTPASIEAIWDSSGAVCLDNPRRPELASAISALCSRPSCGGATSPAGRGHVISANPTNRRLE
jgi:hypothetical protein